MSKGELLSALTPSKQAQKGEKPKISLSKAKIEKIRKEFNESKYKFSKLKIKEITKILYEIQNEKNSSVVLYGISWCKWGPDFSNFEPIKNS